MRFDLYQLAALLLLVVLVYIVKNGVSLLLRVLTLRIFKYNPDMSATVLVDVVGSIYQFIFEPLIVFLKYQPGITFD